MSLALGEHGDKTTTIPLCFIEVDIKESLRDIVEGSQRKTTYKQVLLSGGG